jgi:hypothetical protein
MRTLAVIVLALSLGAHQVEACSISGGSVNRYSTDLRFMATFLPDTALAGPGAVRPGANAGHFGRGDRRSIHGQLVVLGALPSRTAHALPPGARTAVLVPWDYAADCRPVAWSRSAVWLTPGQEGLVSARLRAPEHWADGLPTFDVFRPQLQPYDPSHGPWAGSDSLGPRALPALQLMYLLDSLPPVFGSNGRADTLVERRVIERLHADPALRDRYPVVMIVHEAARILESARLRGIRPPFAGTLKLELSFDDGPWRTMWARTDPHPLAWRADESAAQAMPPDPLAPTPYTRYELGVHSATAREALPRDCRERRAINDYGYVDVARHAADAHRTPGRWRIGIQESVIDHVFTDADKARADSIRRAWAAGLTSKSPGTAWAPKFDIQVERPARGDGATLAGTTVLDGHGTVRVRGVQVDTLTVTCPF